MGKGAGNGGARTKEESSTGAVDKKEVLIDGKFYDVTNFAKKHPGGSVIDFYAGKGIDATQAFNNFHVRSKSAKKIMDSMPNRAATKQELESNLFPGGSDLLNDFNQLTQELKEEGFFKPAPLHVAYRVLEIVAMHAIGFYFLFNQQVLLGTVILGLVSGRCGWLMHEGGHYSLTGVIAIDRALQIVLYGVGCGMSGGWWRDAHNKHHSMPQKIGHDVDLQTLPLVAFTSKLEKLGLRISSSTKRWVKDQALLFPIITTLLVALGWQFYLHPRFVVRKKNVWEFLALTTRYALWTYYITGTFGLLQSAAIYLAYNWFAANYIFINFAVSHTHLDTVDEDDTKVDWVRYAAIHTMNVSSGPFKFVDWWMSYLNFQIEHHLFPSMPQFRHPIVSKRVQVLFAKHGLKYDQRDYITAMKVTFANLHKVGYEVFKG